MVISLLLICVLMFAVSASFAADENITLGEVDDEIAIDDDVLSVEEDTDALSVDDESSEVVSASATVTNATFHKYFDNNGTLLNNVSDDELVFEGDFTGVDVNYISIDKSIKLTGKNAIFKNVSFVISSSNAEINKFDITGSDYALIYLSDGSNVTISNCKINFTGIEDSNNYVIYAVNVTNLKLIGNTITYVGNTNGDYINNAIRVEKGKNVLVENNQFDVTIPSRTIDYNDYPNSLEFSNGMAFFGCENLNIAKNNLTINYNDFSGYSDTIKAILVGNPNYDFDADYEMIYPNLCNNVLIEENNIVLNGHAYAYGISISASNSTVNNNILNISSENYAAGFDIGGFSDNITISNNLITAKAPKLAYGIYSYAYGFPVTNMTYYNNKIIGDAYGSCGMEIVEVNPTISKNIIVLTGNHTTGIVANMQVNGNISDNTISSLGTNNGTDGTGDGMVHKESIGISVNGDTLISNNDIISTAIGINLDDFGLAGNMVVSGNTIKVDTVGDIDNYAIYVDSMDGVNITNNKISFKGKTNGTYDSNAISVSSSNNVTISNNDLDVTLTAGAGSAIIAENCPELIISDNTVNFGCEGYANWGSNDVIFVNFGCDDAKIMNNKINALGSTYVYGIKVYSQNFTIDKNNLVIKSDVGSAWGISPDAGASGVVKNNNIDVTGVETAYGIYSGMWAATSPLVVNYTNNVIKASAFFASGIEVGGAKENIVANDISLEGNFTIGVGLYKYAQDTIDTTIKDNVILSKGNNIGDPSTVWESIGIETTGIKINSGNVTISDNNVETTGDYAMNLCNSNATVTDNKLLAAKSSGDMSIANKGNAAVSGSSPEFKTILFASDLTKTEGAADQYIVTAMDENGNVIANKTISISINGATQNATTDEKGVAKFNIDLKAGNYTVTAIFAGDKVYGQKTITNAITVNAKPTPVTKKTVKITAKKKTFKAKTKTKKYTITLKADNKAVKGLKVTLKVKGKTYKATTNAKGKATFKIKNLKKKGKYNAKITFAGNANYNKATKSVKITVKK